MSYGAASWTWGICSTCDSRWYHHQLSLHPDWKTWVCPNCADEPNPYLHFRAKTDNINIPHPRPDVPLVPDEDP